MALISFTNKYCQLVKCFDIIIDKFNNIDNIEKRHTIFGDSYIIYLDDQNEYIIDTTTLDTIKFPAKYTAIEKMFESFIKTSNRL